MKRLLLTLFLLALGSLAAPALAASYSVAVQTNQASYVGTAQIAISGTVSPAPGPNTAVIVVVSNPAQAVVDIESDAVNPSTGSFSQLTVAGGGMSCGGSPCWIAGTYLVNATWSGSGGSAVGTATFNYLPAVPLSTSVSCAPASFALGASSQCTATVSGSPISISGETVAFSQTGGPGSVSFPSPATCALSGNACSVAVTGGSPGQVTIQASYTGVNPAISGTAGVTVTKATTATSVSCAPPNAEGANQFEVGLSSSCTVDVSGWAGAVSGENVGFSQTGGTGSVTFSPLATQGGENGSAAHSPATCALFTAGGQTSCQVTVTGGSVGSATIQAAYGGDTDNAGSSGNTTIEVMLLTTIVATPPTTTSSSSSSTVGVTSPTTSSRPPAGGGLGSAVYIILAAVAVVVVLALVFGVVIWRRRAAGGDIDQPARR